MSGWGRRSVHPVPKYLKVCDWTSKCFTYASTHELSLHRLLSQDKIIAKQDVGLRLWVGDGRSSFSVPVGCRFGIIISWLSMAGWQLFGIWFKSRCANRLFTALQAVAETKDNTSSILFWIVYACVYMHNVLWYLFTYVAYPSLFCETLCNRYLTNDVLLWVCSSHKFYLIFNLHFELSNLLVESDGLPELCLCRKDNESVGGQFWRCSSSPEHPTE